MVRCPDDGMMGQHDDGMAGRPDDQMTRRFADD